MEKVWIDVDICDNDNKDFWYCHVTSLPKEEWLILKDYESEEYDQVWDKLCNQIERVMPYGQNWYIDHIEEHKKGRRHYD